MKLTATDLFPGSGDAFIEITSDVLPSDPAWVEAWIERGMRIREHFLRVHTSHKINAMIEAGVHSTRLPEPFTPGCVPYGWGSGKFWIPPALRTIWMDRPEIEASHWKRTTVTNRLCGGPGFLMAIFEPDDTEKRPQVYTWPVPKVMACTIAAAEMNPQAPTP